MSEATGPKNIEIAKLAQEVEQAEAQLSEAIERSSRASREESDARNRVNRAQKALDDYLSEWRKGASRSTDWARERELKYEVPSS